MCVVVSSEKYFDMKKNQCKEALEIYKTFLNRMTKLSEFLKVAEVRSLCAAEGDQEPEHQSGASFPDGCEGRRSPSAPRRRDLLQTGASCGI